MHINPRDFIDRFGRRVLTDGGQAGRDGVEGLGSTTEELQGRVAAAIYANCERLNDGQIDELMGWLARYKSRPSTWYLFEHEDGRQAVARDDAATFTHGEPKWHRCYPVEVHGAVDGAAIAAAPAGDDRLEGDVAAEIKPAALRFMSQLPRHLVSQAHQFFPAGAHAGSVLALCVAENAQALAAAGNCIARGAREGQEQADRALRASVGLSSAATAEPDFRREGVMVVSAGFDDIPFVGCPPAWTERPFAKIRWFSDAGDASVSEPARAGWTLAADQSGTVVADLALAGLGRRRDEGASGAPE